MPVLLETMGTSSGEDSPRISQQLAEDLTKIRIGEDGRYSIETYYTLDGSYFVEFVNGCIQVLPMPTYVHQWLMLFFADLLRAWAKAHDPKAKMVIAPFFVQLTPALVRQPDVSLLLGSHVNRHSNKRWLGADLAVEIVSDSNRGHETVTKRREYAAHGVLEYWIVDPMRQTFTVLVLNGEIYREHGEFVAGQTATSVLVTDIAINVAALFAEAEKAAE